MNQHWSKDYAAPLVERNIIVGYEDGSFAPDQPITRQEFAVILVRALGLTEQAAALTDTGNFADGQNIADWSKNSVALLSQMGILTGYDDGEFKPEKNINREEMAVLIARCVKNDNVKMVPSSFADKDAISGWAAQDIEKVYSLGIITGYEDGSFKPAQNVTRAETCVMVYNYMEASGLL